MKTKTSKMFDVLAVRLNDLTVRFMATGKTKENADSIVKMAVMRRGVDEEYFTTVKAGTYKEGDKYKGAY